LITKDLMKLLDWCYLRLWGTLTGSASLMRAITAFIASVDG